MITKTTQNWSTGSMVKVGFLTLKVTGMKGAAYLLESTKGIQYSFTPYTGLIKLQESIWNKL